ncbi:MAG: HD domain-containing protein [Lachnospiraceae bacterium]|nr:HD domain-containing protein [Lachnospiraceae bacterium]MDO5550550.1 HD domain-containing protein [Lachnospiraceae bacterium]
MEIQRFMELMDLSERLKNHTRHSWTSAGRHESVAEHSWRLTLMAYFVKDEFPQADMDKVIRMCILHDFGEAFTGDIPAFLKTEQDSNVERDRISQWVSGLPEPFAKELAELFQEMEALETLEAKIYKALDKMEAVIQHNEADISTWLPLEYDLQMNYGAREVAFSDYMKALKAEANRISEDKIRQEQGRK